MAMMKEEQTLRQLTQLWYDAERNKDIDAYMSYIADDCVLHAPGALPMVGKEAIRQMVTPYIESLVSVTDNIHRIVVAASGDLAYQIGDQQMINIGPDGEVEGETKYVIVWQKSDDKWQCATMSFNFNKPML